MGGSPFYEVISQKIFFFTNDGFPKVMKVMKVMKIMKVKKVMRANKVIVCTCILIDPERTCTNKDTSA